MYLGKTKTSSNIAWHRPQSASSIQEEDLIQRSTRALASTTDPVEKLRLLCLSRGAAGILGFARIFRRMDAEGSKQLNKAEFINGIKETGLELDDESAEGSKQLNKAEFINGIKETGLELDDESAEALFEKFDPDNCGLISLDEFIREIRPPMSESRRAIVTQAFKKLDKTGDGAITVHDIRRVYSPNAHPRYMSGEETADLIMTRFLANFETEGAVDGTVTLEEFMDYYSGLSVSIDSDCFFDLMMRQAFKL